MKTLTLKQLLDALRNLDVPDDTPVILEGCDCWGTCDGVAVDTHEDYTQQPMVEVRVVAITRGTEA